MVAPGKICGLDALQDRLGYRFVDSDLLASALTHKSSSFRPDNERLEYLGDAVLQYLISVALYRIRPTPREGVLTRVRSALVRAESLDALACQMRLGECLRVGNPALLAAGRAGSALRANALEAVIGAVHEDGGLDAALALVERLFADRLQNWADSDVKDAKSALQELVQARSLAPPDYRIVKQSGPPHRPTFLVSCEVPALGVAITAEGPNRRVAEQQAAETVLARISQQET